VLPYTWSDVNNSQQSAAGGSGCRTGRDQVDRRQQPSPFRSRVPLSLVFGVGSANYSRLLVAQRDAALIDTLSDRLVTLRRTEINGLVVFDRELDQNDTLYRFAATFSTDDKKQLGHGVLELIPREHSRHLGTAPSELWTQIVGLPEIAYDPSTRRSMMRKAFGHPELLPHIKHWELRPSSITATQ